MVVRAIVSKVANRSRLLTTVVFDKKGPASGGRGIGSDRGVGVGAGDGEAVGVTVSVGCGEAVLVGCGVAVVVGVTVVVSAAAWGGALIFTN
jgi:hypothetical protein